jgi:hypothetical protein
MKFRYPITADYVSNWTLAHAVREIIANALDSEAEHGAKFSIKYDEDQQRLIVRNEDIKVDPKALYFGESSKRNDDRFVGQYGEGLKLAMLVFARNDLDVRIKNGDSETWKPLIEKDGLGVETLCVDITKAKRAENNFEVVIPGITEEFWEMMQGWFLRLKAPCDVHHTSVGELLDDPEFTGKIYVRGVYVTTREKYDFGYNFSHVDTGRDRRVPSTYDLDWAISRMWSELSSKDNAKLVSRMFRSFEREAAEQDVFTYSAPDNLVDSMLTQFRSEYGDDSVPVVGTAEGTGLEHIGLKPVPLAPRLVSILRRRLPSPEKMIQEYSEKIEERFALDALTEIERYNLNQALDLIQPHVEDASGRTVIVRFASTKVEGLHHNKQIFISRASLADFGKLLMLLVHEFAHDFGVDGTASHVSAIHKISEAVINALWAAKPLQLNLQGATTGRFQTTWPQEPVQPRSEASPSQD